MPNQLTHDDALAFLRETYGASLVLGPCLIGQNLNLLTVSGFAPLDQLAAVSAPDVYDMVDNKLGTQRDLNKKHALECLDYALGAVALPASDEPRFFPEILLNVRSSEVVRIREGGPDGPELDFHSVNSDPELAGELVWVEVLFDRLKLPKPLRAPDISRVDGNHRLWAIDDALTDAASAEDGDDDDEFAIETPTVAFSLLVGLSPDQEAFLFRSINGEHKGMEVAHLAQLALRVADHERLKAEKASWPQWIAHELTVPGRSFHQMVFFGGSKAGVKREYGKVPPVKLSTLVSTTRRMIQSSKIGATRIESAEQWLKLADRYWASVRDTFPESWEDSRGHILLKTIGLTAFADLGAYLIDEGLEAKNLTAERFKHHLQAVRDNVPLDSDERWKGVAGAGGATLVSQTLLAAATSDSYDKHWLASELNPLEADDAEKLAGFREHDDE